MGVVNSYLGRSLSRSRKWAEAQEIFPVFLGREMLFGNLAMLPYRVSLWPLTHGGRDAAPSHPSLARAEYERRKEERSIELVEVGGLNVLMVDLIWR
jgi:hypothetical protein